MKPARDPARQLPPTVALGDFNNVVRVGELPRPLTMDGVPAGADPAINDIGLVPASNGLVSSYGDVGYFNGIVRLGTLPANGMHLSKRQTGTVTGTIEAA